MQNKCLMGCLEFTATGLDPQIMKNKKKVSDFSFEKVQRQKFCNLLQKCG